MAEVSPKSVAEVSPKGVAEASPKKMHVIRVCNIQGLSWADTGGPARPINFNMMGRGPARPIKF